MSFERLLAAGRLRPRKTRRDDIQHILQLADPDLADSSVPGLSSDRRFLIAYEAGLALATIPIYCGGYETHGSGHHWMTFQLLPHLVFSGDHIPLLVPAAGPQEHNAGPVGQRQKVEPLPLPDPP